MDVGKENKVTSYKLSERLHELGFDYEHNTGWWIAEAWSESEEGDGKTQVYKAYDCHDLLMWLHKFQWCVYPNKQTYLIGRNTFGVIVKSTPMEESDFWDGNLFRDQPQDALAKAIITILSKERKFKDKKEGN